MKALVLDMDGTILDHSGRFPRSLVAVLAALKEEGCSYSSQRDGHITKSQKSLPKTAHLTVMLRQAAWGSMSMAS
ncbi:hypothetical protein [Salinicoccus sp. CNSTN-B1]